MKRRRVIVVLLGCMVAAIVVAIVWPREREPEYEGKKLSEWLVISQTSNVTLRESQEATDAVRRIGPNALPWLVRWCGYEPPPWRTKLLLFLVQRTPRAFQTKSFLRGLQFLSSEREYSLASGGFSILAEQASPAVPELTRLLKESKAPGVLFGAVNSLASIGEAGVPPIVAVLTNQASWWPLRVTAAISLGSLKSNVPPVLPVLVKCIQDKDEQVSVKAAQALGNLGEAARPAVPLLLSIYKDPTTARERKHAERVLRQIAPEVLGKAGDNGEGSLKAER